MDQQLSRAQDKHRPDGPIEVEEESPPVVPTPHSIQAEALRRLAQTRDDGRLAGLVVLATGLGKTWLSAFDSCKYLGLDFLDFLRSGEKDIHALAESRRRRKRELGYDCSVSLSSII